ncbi:Alb1-domain-containing protein [Mariannaea sp. PMI_226]|nr:Alb1-domain-containing protein [Mariannaea sp. PMI_226]
MAKKRGPSVHSRAARRATSPSIDTDKSLKDFRPPSRVSAARPSVLAVHSSAGVQKKSSQRGRKSQLSAKARRRHEKGLEMAEAVIERTRSKVEKSMGRGRVVKERSKTWEDINKKATFALLKDEADEDDEDDAKDGQGWVTDDDMDGAGEKAPGVPAPSAETSVPAAMTTSQPIPTDDDDEIL